MATRASGKKKTKGKIPMKGDPRKGSRGKVAKVAKKRGRGDNSGDHAVPDEVYERHLSKIDSTAKAMEKAKEAYDQAKGVHQSAYKAAKNDGCDIDAIRLARKLDKQDAGVTQVTYANVSRVLNIMGSPLGSQQLDLFGSIAQPEVQAKVDPGAQGLNAGRNGENRGNNPFNPGTPEFEQWDGSWIKGQAEIVKTMTPN